MRPRGFQKGNQIQKGAHRSRETRKKISKNHADVSGRNNPNYGRQTSKIIKTKISTSIKSWYKIHPVTKNRKKEMSQAFQGKNNPKYKDGRTLKNYYCIDCGNELITYKATRCDKCNRKFYSGQNGSMYGKPSPHAKKSYYKGTWMRSSWEVNIAQWLDRHNIKWEYEPKRFVLKDRTYLPDFYLKDRNIYWEVKGWFDEKSQETIKQFRELYPNENLLVLTKPIYESIIGGK